MRSLGKGVLLLAACSLACQKRAEVIQGSGPVLVNWTPADLLLRQSVDLAALFPLARGVVFDPEAGILLPANKSNRIPWPEHPNGSYRQCTNSLGLLETSEVDRKHGLRLLVLGDSHMMSVDPTESFPNLLEAGLRKSGF